MTARRRLRRLNLSTRLQLLALPRSVKLAAMVGLDLIAIGMWCDIQNSHGPMCLTGNGSG